MIERRVLERIPLDQLALVASDEIRGAHPAFVRNISPAGACISLPAHFCANVFKLSFDGFRRSVTCRIVWKTGELCGVSFVSDWCGSQAATLGEHK
ncbi:PilZ domain-containing protein [Bradyrhizobium diazoefficiens]|nr:PilZ domain-containing protein [Bradyrhizobium diazoefficiens]MBR0777219.1 PilZ domain-containing protein [Bradyrhizobium diazoefficiens]